MEAIKLWFKYLETDDMREDGAGDFDARRNVIMMGMMVATENRERCSTV